MRKPSFRKRIVPAVLTGALLALPLCVPVGAQAAPPWRLVRTIDTTQIVLVEVFDAKDPAVYRAAVQALCTGKKACKVLFWSEESLLPETLPLSAAQQGGVTASWHYDESSGSGQLLTAFDPATDSDDCQ